MTLKILKAVESTLDAIFNKFYEVMLSNREFAIFLKVMTTLNHSLKGRKNILSTPWTTVKKISRQGIPALGKSITI